MPHARCAIIPSRQSARAGRRRAPAAAAVAKCFARACVRVATWLASPEITPNHTHASDSCAALRGGAPPAVLTDTPWCAWAASRPNTSLYFTHHACQPAVTSLSAANQPKLLLLRLRNRTPSHHVLHHSVLLCSQLHERRAFLSKTPCFLYDGCGV